MMHRSQPRRRQTIAQIFSIPLLIAVLSTVGLVSALVGDGMLDAISWVTLGIPVVLCAWFLLKKQ